MRLLTTTILLVTIFASSCSNKSESESELESEISVPDNLHSSGLVLDENVEIVVTNCTPCHSAKLISQNRASREGWMDMIDWMQETQNLWQLGENEEIIVDYLVKHYSPQPAGRRKPLANVEWYDLQ